MIPLLLQQHRSIDSLAKSIELRLSSPFEPVEIKSLVHGLIGRVWLHLSMERSPLSQLSASALIRDAAPPLPASLDAICQHWSEDAIAARPALFREEFREFIDRVRARVHWEEATLYNEHDPVLAAWRALLDDRPNEG